MAGTLSRGRARNRNDHFCGILVAMPVRRAGPPAGVRLARTSAMR